MTKKKKTTAVKRTPITVTKIKDVMPKPTLKQRIDGLCQDRNFMQSQINETDKDLQAMHEQHSENEAEIRKAHTTHVASTKAAIGKLDLHVFILYASVIALAVIQFVA